MMVPISEGLRLNLCAKYTISFTLSFKMSYGRLHQHMGDYIVKKPCISPRNNWSVKQIFSYSYILIFSHETLHPIASCDPFLMQHIQLRLYFSWDYANPSKLLLSTSSLSASMLSIKWSASKTHATKWRRCTKDWCQIQERHSSQI